MKELGIGLGVLLFLVFTFCIAPDAVSIFLIGCMVAIPVLGLCWMLGYLILSAFHKEKRNDPT